MLFRSSVRAARRAVAAAPDATARPSPWRDLKEGLAYVWHTPFLRLLMFLAFMLNVTSFPLTYSLLPYVAKEVYHAGQTGLGYMVASVGAGALVGAAVLSRYGSFIRPGRMMMIASAAWYAALLALAQTPHLAAGIPVLVLVGWMQATSQVPMAALLLRTADERYRGRVMGMRMLAIYGNIPGLLLSAPLIAHFGYSVTATLYCAIGLAFVLLIAVRWRAHFWRLEAPANTR